MKRRERRRVGADADVGDPIDRRESDGEAGAGDMLGGLSAGVGDRLGPDQGIERGGVTIPMAGDVPGYKGQTVPAEDADEAEQADEAG